jgi:hypothetical protein
VLHAFSRYIYIRTMININEFCGQWAALKLKKNFPLRSNTHPSPNQRLDKSFGQICLGPKNVGMEQLGDGLIMSGANHLLLCIQSELAYKSFRNYSALNVGHVHQF